MNPTPENRQQFPHALLAQPIHARQAYFETKFAKHHILEQVHDKLLHAIRYPAGASLIKVFGPTGVGKSTLLNHIAAQLIKDAVADPTTTLQATFPLYGSRQQPMATAPSSGKTFRLVRLRNWMSPAWEIRSPIRCVEFILIVRGGW